MGKINYAQTNFSSGEFSPMLEGRFDVSKYFNGSIQLENFIVKSFGGAFRRPGSYFVSEVKDSAKKTRLVAFQFSTEQAYILEFGDYYVRFYKDDGQITLSGTAYEKTTPYSENEIFDLKFAQSADTLYVAHKDHAPAKITRTGHTSWSITNISFTWGSTPNPWSSSDGFPSCVTFFEQRLWWAGSPKYPQTIWASKSEDYENMTQGVNDSDALEYTIADNQVNAIMWLVATKVLVVGTSDGQFILSSDSSSGPLTPSNVMIKRETSYGTIKIMPKRIGNYLYYVQRNSRTVREFSYSFDSDSYVALDMTLLAEHISLSGIVDMDYQESPDNVLWCVREDGQMATLTRQIDQQIIGWSRQITDGKYKSVAVIPKGEEDQVWTIVERTIGGVAKQYVEYFMPFLQPTAQEDLFYVDCGLTYDGSPITTVSGLDHLSGKTVAVLTDGASHPSRTVNSDGQITLERSASVIQAGLPYYPKLKTLRLEGGSQGGSAQGLIKRIFKATIRFYKSLNCKVGRDEDNINTIFFRDSSMNMNEPPTLYTGDKEIQFPAGYDKEARVYITSDQPLPLNILAIIFKVDVSEI